MDGYQKRRVAVLEVWVEAVGGDVCRNLARSVSEAIEAVPPMKGQRLLLAALLCAALVGSLPLGVERWRLFWHWRSAAPPEREAILFGPYAATIAKVRRTVPENGTILLFAGVDPALFPYALYPRRLWQVRTDPETNDVYMQSPPPVFAIRTPASFPVGWHLFVSAENLAEGGDLRPAADPGLRGGR